MSVLLEQPGSQHRADDALYRPPRARGGARACACLDRGEERALERMAARIEASSGKIIEANRQDLEAAQSQGSRRRLPRPAAGWTERGSRRWPRACARWRRLPDPVGQVMARWTRPNGLEISRVRVPLGVIGIIYESRPNVTADAAALCLKSGNAVILRSGSESFLTSLVIANALSEAWSPRVCPRPRSSSCRRSIARRSASCSRPWRRRST